MEQRGIRRNFVAHGNLAVNPERRPVTVKRKRVVKIELPVAEKMLYLTGLLICLTVTAFILAQYLELVQLNYQTQELKRQILQAEEEHQNLQLDLAAQSTPKKIQQTAKEMGMTEEAGKVVVLPSESSQEAIESDLASRGEEGSEVQADDRDS